VQLSLFSLSKVLLFSVLSFSVVSQAYEDEIRKPPKDEREYHAFKLENDLQVFLIHDDRAENSTAVLSVGVGSFQDPKSRQGLAHFLEHMILIQSEKYPETNGLRAFVEANGGWANAYTSGSTTGYYATASRLEFAQLLDRMSAAIQAPVFDSAYVEKEVSAIDAEWYRQNQTNGFYFSRVLAETANKRHPATKLNVGNRKTLLGKRPEKINDDLKSFHQQYYSSNVMKLVLAGPQTLEALEQLSRRYFSNMKNNNIEIASIEQPIFKKKHLARHIYVSTKGSSSSLIMQFAVPKVQSRWRNKSFDYLSMLFSSQQKGSLIDVLKRAGLVRDFQTAMPFDELNATNLIELSFELTEEGLESKDEIVATTFDFIKLIREEGVNEQYEAQIARRQQRSLEQYVPWRLEQSAFNVARDLHAISPENVIFAPYFFEGIDEQEIRLILSTLTPENMRLWSTGPDLETPKLIKDAFGSYAIKRIPKARQSNWTSGGLETSLMVVGEPPINGQAFKVAYDQRYQKPKVIYQHLNTRAILAHSEEFQDETGYLTLVLRNPYTAQSAENWVYSVLLHHAFEEQNQAFEEAEGINTGTTVSVFSDAYGNTTFTVDGKSQHHQRILLELLHRFKTLAIEKADLTNSHFAMNSFYENRNSLDVGEQLLLYRNEVAQVSQIFKTPEILNALSNVTLASLKDTHEKLVQSSFIDIFAMGNYDEERLLGLVAEVNTLFPVQGGVRNWRFESPFSVSSGKKLSYNVDMRQRGVAIADIYISPYKSAALAAQAYLLSFIMSEPAHSKLRTEQQLGYAVSLWTSPLHDYPTITVRIESNTTDLPDLKQRITDFIKRYKSTLDTYTEEELSQLKKAITANSFREPDSLQGEVRLLLRDWDKDNLSFDTRDKRKQVIHATTKGDLIALYNKLFSSEAANIVVQLKGADDIDSEFFDWSPADSE
jgi:protease-3